MSKARELANLGNAYSDGALSNRNLIINGAMQVAQRGTSFSVPSNYTLDRWKVLRYLYGNYTVSQQDTGGLAGFNKCLRVQRNSGTSDTTEIAVNQPIEGFNSKHLAGKTVTLSFWARVGSDYAGQAGYFISAIAYTTNTSDIGMYYDNFYSNGTALRQVNTPSTSWTYYTMTVDIPSSANQIGVAISTQSWAGTAGANDYYEITGVQLEVGDTATPFEHRSYGQELALCQRYYWKKQYGNYRPLGLFRNGHGLPMIYPVPMRSTPTSSSTCSASAGISVWTAYNSYANYSGQVTASPIDEVSWNLFQSAYTTANQMVSCITYSGNFYVDFDAEL
jgi:hypothetical protein